MNISLNKMEFSKEVHKLVNIFYPNEKIYFNCKDSDLEIKFDDNHIVIQFMSKEKSEIYRVEKDSKARTLQKALYTFLKELTGIEAPWGILVGIRPSKIAVKLLQQGYDKKQIINYYEEEYLTSAQKAELCYEVATLENTYIDESTNKVSVYIGMPFCPTRCVYCSFASNPIKGCNDLVLPYLYALKYEMEAVGKYLLEKNIKVQCIYFGGGTPTSVNDDEFAFIMETIHENISKFHNIEEYTVECGRPDSITERKLLTMKQYGVHRISINPQTMNDSTLKKIGRHHKVIDVIEKFNLARKIGFDNINMDMIVGLPNEGMKEVNITCQEILKLQPESLTVHGMSLKRASKMHEDHLNSNTKLEVEHISEIYAMFNATRELALNLEMKPYYLYRQKNMVGNMENIGYSKINKQCIYNILMIEEKQTIVAFGADAISKIIDSKSGVIERVANLKDVKQYTDRVDEMIKLKIDLLNKLFN